MSEEEQKPVPTELTKSSMEILSELFSTFDAEPPVIVKKEKEEGGKKHKKSKKKHKHKDKKHKKKDKKRKRTDSASSDSSAVDLAHLLIKRERQSPEKKIKLDRFLLGDDKPGEESQITIKKFKFKSVIEAIITEDKGKIKKEKEDEEEGEISSSDGNVNEVVDKKRKKKKRKRDEKKSKKHSERENGEKKSKKAKVENGRSKSKEKSDKSEDKRSRSHDRKVKSPIRWSKERNGSDYKSKDRDKEKYADDYKSRDDYYRDRRDDSRSRNHDDYKHRHRENPFYKASDDSKARNSHEKDDKWFTRDRYRGYNEHEKDRRRYRDRSNSKEGDNHIDKKKLLEIARRNAISMMKSGSLPAALTLGPQAQEKVLAAIKAGGKTIEELTDFCKTLSKKEELGELSSNSAGEDGDDSDVESKAFHHPFQLKDRPTSIIMNIKNSVPLPTKTAQERNSDLRLQFPVSSGTHHRKTENEWIPVTPKKVETTQILAIKAAPAVPPSAPLAIEAPPPSEPSPPILSTLSALPGPQVFPMYSDPNVNIGAIVTQRLSAIRKLQENPYDVEALGEMHKSQKEMQSWAESKLQPGQFTGSTGANILSQAELASGYQTWAKKDQLQNAAPVSGGMGMHLLRKMGWNPGEGLGKEKTGALEPLLLEVKLNKKGLVASEEQKRRGGQKTTKSAVKTLESKHPVSLLGEFTAKKKLGAPEYTLCLESGPDHKKMFLFKVSVNGMECKPDIASPNKKQAKADAAKLCLQRLGILI